MSSRSPTALSTPWVAQWYREPAESGRAALYACYVDITTVPVINGDCITVVDLDLDVAVSWDGATPAAHGVMVPYVSLVSGGLPDAP